MSGKNLRTFPGQVCSTPECCDTRIAAKGLCKRCYDKTRTPRRSARWLKKARAFRKAARARGLCSGYKCTNRPAPGHAKCIYHLAKSQQSSRKNRENTIIRRYRVRHGETYENKLKRIKAQRGRCANALCRTSKPGSRGWLTDTDKKSGRTAELCSWCIYLVHVSHRNVKILKGLIDYLKRQARN